MVRYTNARGAVDLLVYARNQSGEMYNDLHDRNKAFVLVQNMQRHG